MIGIQGLAQAKIRLARIDVGRSVTTALESTAGDLQSRLVVALSTPPGTDHAVPWLRTGKLRASIGHQTDGAVAVVGSSSEVAVDQELGTPSIPPRPFLAPTAARSAHDVVRLLADLLWQHLAER